MKKIIVIVCAVVMACCMTSCSSSSPSAVVKEYYKALKAGDFEKALSYTTITDQKEVQKHVKKLQGAELKVLDYEVLAEKIAEDGESAVVTVKSTVSSAYSDEPQEATKDLELVKVDGKWKIDD